MAARVLLTVMTADEDALTAVDLAERLEVSPAAISGAVRHLMTIGLIRREPVPGSRRDLYMLISETWWEATVTKMTRLRALSALTDEGVVAVGGEKTRPGRTLAEMRDFLDFFDEELPALLEKWRARN